MKPQELLLATPLIILESLTALAMVFLVFVFSASPVPAPSAIQLSATAPSPKIAQPFAQKTYLIQVTDRQQRPIVDALVTVLDEPTTSRTNEKGLARLPVSQSKKISLAAFGYTTQTVELPPLEENPTPARYQLKKNPMTAVIHIAQERS